METTNRRRFLASGGAAAAALCVGARGAAAGATQAAVETGLDRVVAEKGGPLKGLRVGFVVHAASVGANGQHAIEALRGAGVDLRRLFTPEHGLRGRAAAGEQVAGGLDPESGLPVVSLYGGKNKPDPEDLAGLDALVFDLQDAGVRFYTYSSTLLLCLEAAAEAGLELVVLDRPNPLGGLLFEGPRSDPPDLVARSLVNMTPGPLVHGLTAGELARYVGSKRAKPGPLRVVPMSGWRRSMSWQDTGRPWPLPSPNLRSAEAALAYPGTCLLEGTTVSEGRGSEAPFLLVGAPWLRSEELVPRIEAPGFAFEPVGFTPRPSEAAPRPRFEGYACRGLRVSVTDAAAARPYAMGVALLAALRDVQPEFGWRTAGGAGFERLTGTRVLREAIDRGDSAAAILAADEPALAAWREERKPALLY
jgi:uncharacterized protein YbbC (DUF1343 family)